MVPRNNHHPHPISPPHFSQIITDDELQVTLDLLREEDIDLVQLTKHLQSRPVLIQIVMRAVNSVKIGNQQPVSSLRHAILLLGLDRTRKAILEGTQELRQSDTGLKIVH